MDQPLLTLVGPELLRALVDDDDCLLGLTALVDDIINGRLSGQERDYILTGTLVAGRKRDGVSVRPIAMGEVFSQLAGHYSLYLVNPKLPGLLGLFNWHTLPVVQSVRFT